MIDDRDLETAVRLLRHAPRHARPELTNRIMTAVGKRARPIRITKRHYQIPIAAAAALLLFVAFRSYDARGSTPTVASGETVVRFELVDPNALTVALAGDFNRWSVTAVPLRRDGSGRPWTAEVRLPPGRFSYSFVIDGRRWVADPSAARAPRDDFDSPSSVVVVPISKAKL